MKKHPVQVAGFLLGIAAVVQRAPWTAPIFVRHLHQAAKEAAQVAYADDDKLEHHPMLAAIAIRDTGKAQLFDVDADHLPTPVFFDLEGLKDIHPYRDREAILSGQAVASGEGPRMQSAAVPTNIIPFPGGR